MDKQEIEILKNDVDLKIGVLKSKMKRENNYSDIELVKLYEEYQEEGTTIEELKLFNDDLNNALYGE